MNVAVVRWLALLGAAGGVILSCGGTEQDNESNEAAVWIRRELHA